MMDVIFIILSLFAIGGALGMVLFHQRLNRKGWLGLSMLVLSIVLIKMA